MSDLLFVGLIGFTVVATILTIINFWKASVNWAVAGWYWRKIELIYSVSPLAAALAQWEGEVHEDLARRRSRWSSKRAGARRVLDQEAQKERAS